MTSLLLIAVTLFFGAAMGAILFYLGYGVTRLGLPRALAPYTLLLMPFTGMALVIVWDYAALFLNFNLTAATWALVCVTAPVNLLGWRHARMRNAPGVRAQIRAVRGVLVWALVAFCSAVAPLWRYGYLTVIGENWDYEFYLPLADYLRHLSTAQLASAPPNPLLSTILSRHILPLPMGFSYLQASLDTVLNAAALDTFAILLGVLHALGVVAAFVLFRAVLKMSPRAALVASALVALNGLLLWFTYWSFGLHLASLALLPVALVVSITALRDPADWRALVAAGFFLGALNVTYHPALVAAGLPLLVLGLALLITRRDRLRVLWTGIAIVLIALAFSFPTLWHLDDFRREYYGRTPLAIGLREFVPLSDGYGLSLYILDLAVGHTIPTPWLYEWLARGWSLAAPALTLGALAVSLFALWQLRRDPERRMVWYALVGASVFYVLVFRLPFLRPYPYGFLKSLSLIIYLLIALAVAGGAQLLAWTNARRSAPLPARLARLCLLAGGIIAVAVVGLTFALSLEQYFKPAPPFFNADALRVRELDTVVRNQPTTNTPPRVLLTDRTEVQKIPMGLAAYALQGQALYGNVVTGYGTLDNLVEGQVYDYALLARGEQPEARGYTAAPLWQNQTFALYARAPQVDYARALDAQILPAQSLQLTIGATQIVSGTVITDGAPATRTAALGFVTFIPQSVTLAYGSARQELQLPTGLSTFTLPPLTTPITVTITPHAAPANLDAPGSANDFPGAVSQLWVPYAQLLAPTAGQSGQTHSTATIALSCQSRAGGTLDKRCFVVNPNKTELTWRWIVRGTLQGTRQERVLADHQSDGAPLSYIDLRATGPGGLETMQFDRAAPVRFPAQTIPDGKYRADLELYQGTLLLARVELYQFQVQDRGNKTSVTVTRDGALFLIQP